MDDLVVLALLIRLEVVVELLGVSGNVGSASSLEVLRHSAVEGEERGGGTNLGTHVTDGGHTGTRERLDTGTVVLDNGTGSTLDSEDTGDLENNVLGRSPAVHLAVEVDTNDLGGLKLPGDVGHDVDSVGSTNTACNHTETTSVGRVRVGTDHHQTGDGVVFKDDLVATRVSSCTSCCSHDQTYMIPDPGFQKPMPYLAQAVARKS